MTTKTKSAPTKADLEAQAQAVREQLAEIEATEKLAASEAQAKAQADREAAAQERVRRLPEAGRDARLAWEAFLDTVRDGDGREIAAYKAYLIAELHRVAEQRFAHQWRQTALERAYDAGAEMWRRITEAHGVAITAPTDEQRMEARAQINQARREADGLTPDQLPDTTPLLTITELFEQYGPPRKPTPSSEDIEPRYARFTDAIDTALGLITKDQK